jgi:predicted O-methyltransferase YrrM
VRSMEYSMKTHGPGGVAQAGNATLHLIKMGLRTVRAPLHARTLKRVREAGLPLQLYPAMAHLLTGQLHPRDRAVASRVEALRRHLADRGSMTVEEYAHGQHPEAERSPWGVERHTFQEIATRVSVPMSFGLFLYLCAAGFEARRILELGSCAGISGCYLASAPSCTEFVTLEVSPAMAELARDNLNSVTRNATVINADFEKGLPAVIGPETAPFDLVWIDGHHEKDATLRYFAQLRGHVSRGGLMLFDDINWTPQMHEAWDLIRVWPGFSVTLNTNRLGMAVIKRPAEDEGASPVNWELKRKLGVMTLSRE